MLIWRVQPGVRLVRARPRRCIIALSRLDLPTFERPANATSAMAGAGTLRRSTCAPATKVARVTRFTAEAEAST